MSLQQKDSEPKVDQDNNEDKPKSKSKHHSKKSGSCKCSKCVNKHKHHTYVCCKCATIENPDHLNNNPDCIKVKRDPQNIFITFLS